MTENSLGPEDAGEDEPRNLPAVPGDTSYEIDLGDEAAVPEPVHDGGGLELPPEPGIRMPVIPAHLRTVAGVRSALAARGTDAAHGGAFHAVRSPRYLLLAVVWAVVGAFRLIGRLLAWWWLSESGTLRSEAVIAGDSREWLKLHQHARNVRRDRGLVLLGAMAAVVLAVSLLARYAPWWGWAVLAVAALPLLARMGRPEDRPIITPSMTVPRFRVLNADVVLRAYYAAGLGDPIKAGQQITFGSPMSRDGDGSRVVIDLPHGKGLDEAVKARPAIASGLDVTVSQVFIGRDPTSHRRHVLWVADRDPLAVPVGRTPLLACKPADIWKPAPFGLNERGALVSVPLMWNSVLVGALPRQGKALALDTPVPTPSGWTTMGELRDGDWVFDEQGSPCRVTCAHPVRHGRPCYEVEFSDGTVITADAEHLWLVNTRASRMADWAEKKPKKRTSPFSRYQRRSFPQVLTTAEMAGSVQAGHGTDTRANYSVNVAAPLALPGSGLPVDPYTLGVWLGDGTAIHGNITLNREDEPFITAHLEPFRYVPSAERPGCRLVRVLGLQAKLRGLGVLGCKHIPVIYLRASEAQRRALLAGLLDTDGYCSPAGQVQFAVSDERLARDTRHLVSTLGYKSTLTSKRARFNGRDYGLQWIVTFTPPDKVFRLPRKAARQVTTVKASAARRYITAIRPVPSVPVRCLTVDTPNSLYLVSETCIPTHNTFSARLLALYAALDPYVRLSVFDGKGSPDWRKFGLVADSCAFGLTPAKHGLPPEILLATLQEMRADVQDRYDRLSALEAERPDLCPEGKLTRELARDPKFGMPVRLLVIDEVQEYFDLGDISKEIAALLVFMVKVAPGAGVSLLVSTQKPSGIGGTGTVAQQFTSFRDQLGIRFSLRTSSWQVSEMVLGQGAYSEGLDSSTLLPQYKGVGILRGASDESPTVRTHLADGQDTEKILTAARAIRQRAGTLSGVAAGDDTGVPARDVLADLLAVFNGDTGLHWAEAAARLAGQFPDRWADASPESVSAQCRALGVPSVDVKRAGRSAKGCRRSDVETAARSR